MVFTENEGTLAGAWSKRLSWAVQVKGEGREAEKAAAKASNKSDNIVRSTYDKGHSTAHYAKEKIKGAGHSIKGAGHSTKRYAPVLGPLTCVWAV